MNIFKKKIKKIMIKIKREFSSTDNIKMNGLKITVTDKGENGNPILWEVKINSPKYGKKCWISDDCDDPAEFTIFIKDKLSNKWKDLKICDTFEGAVSWVKDNLYKQREITVA